jgi:hypothetical protein
MAISPYAGKPAPREMLVDLTQLERAYYERRLNLADPWVSFGTSGHRGSPLLARSPKRTFWPSPRRFATFGGVGRPQHRGLHRYA